MILRDNVTDDTIEIKIKDGFTPDISLGYKLYPLENGNFYVLDRGEGTDSYKCKVETYGAHSDIDALVLALKSARDNGFDIQLEDFSEGEHIFGENIDYTDPIKVALFDIDDVVHKRFTGSSLRITFIVDGNSQLGFLGTGLWPTLKCLQYAYEANRNWNYKVNVSYSQDIYYADQEYDIGLFKGTFNVTKAEMLELREFYRQVRGDSFQLTSTQLGGLAKVFGARGPSSPTILRIKNIEEKFESVNRYLVKISLHEQAATGVK